MSRSRPLRQAHMVVDLPSDGSCDENENEFETPRRRSARAKKRRVIKNGGDDDDDDDDNVDDVDDADCAKGGKPAPSNSSSDTNGESDKENIDRTAMNGNATRAAKTNARKPQALASLNATIPLSVERMITKADVRAEQTYIKARRAGVKRRYFDLRHIPEEEVIPTGRTIKRIGAWNGHWPALREFMQNTIDHLGLLDPKTGRRHKALRLCVTAGRYPPETETDNNDDDDDDDEKDLLATFRFVCGEEAVCTIVASKDELVIDQLYTYPIAPRALDTGVPDTEKSGASSAGGFGDGFKTAAVALLALGKKSFESLRWHFFAEKQRVDWSFEGADRAAVGTFAKCQVLRVRITRREQTAADERECGTKEHLMRQVIRARGIGTSFVHETVPRLVVFWDLDSPSLIASSESGGDFIGQASAQPAIGGNVLGAKLRPESGVYVKGIWVRKAKIAGTLMCFFGRRLEVNGRDRNDVDDDNLISAVFYVFCHCSNMEYLRVLLSPLKGGSAVDGPRTASAAASACGGNYGKRSKPGSDDNKGSSWLLGSPRFLNRILEQYKDFILHDIMGVPKGAIYVSSKTTNSADPFIKWASEFLSEAGCPLEPIEPGANRCLFREINESELVERCVQVLKSQSAAARRDTNQTSEALTKAFRKLLAYMGLARVRVVFSPRVVVAFAHGLDLYAPKSSLTRELLVKVLNVCQSRVEGADGECFSSLMQAVFETLPPGSERELHLQDLDRVIDKAKSIRKDSMAFFVQPGINAAGLNSGDEHRGSEPVSQKGKPARRTTTPIIIDLTLNESPGGSVGNVARNGGQKRESPLALPDLEEQISRVCRAARLSASLDGERRRKGKRSSDGDGDGDDADPNRLPPIIPASDFARDNAGTADACLRPNSHLRAVRIGGNDFLPILCDPATAEAVSTGSWDGRTAAQLSTLRAALDGAIDLVGRSVPSLRPLLGRVRHGYDSANDDYEAFCDGTQIVVNLYAYMGRVPLPPPPRAAAEGGGAPTTTQELPQPKLIHDLAITVTHELAHFLEPTEGHGPVWRDTHMRMVVEIMSYLSRETEVTS